MKNIIHSFYVRFLFSALFYLSVLSLAHCDNPNEFSKINNRIAVLEYAKAYSGTESKRNWDDEYWDIICEFNSVSEYKQAMINNRQDNNVYASKEDSWF